MGILLAGGASRRLGRDKALLVLEGETLAARAAGKLAAACAEVALADRGRHLLPGRPSLPDGPGDGPAAGILGAALAYPGRPLLVLACDLPRIPAALLVAIVEIAREGRAGAADVGAADVGAADVGAADVGAADWIVPRHHGDRLEPLCALYGPAALAALAAAVAAGERALHRLAGVPGLAIRFLGEETLARFGDPEAMFWNVNAPADLAALDGG